MVFASKKKKAETCSFQRLMKSKGFGFGWSLPTENLPVMLGEFLLPGKTNKSYRCILDGFLDVLGTLLFGSLLGGLGRSQHVYMSFFWM